MRKRNTIWIETPTGGFEWDRDSERPYDPTAAEEDRPRVYAELPPADWMPEEPTDPYKVERGVFVF